MQFASNTTFFSVLWQHPPIASVHKQLIVTKNVVVVYCPQVCPFD